MNIGELIGSGHTACVYEWDEGRVVKLFHTGYPEEAVENEYHNALVVRDMPFAKPKAYELVRYEDKSGIIYDKLEGESLLDRVLMTGDVEECAATMAMLHNTIILNTSDEIPNYKDFLKSNIPYAILSKEEHEELLHRIEDLPEGNSLCHGDFHPGNILISEGTPYVIDFMNICLGNYLYDVARTVFLIEFTPVPDNADDKDNIISMKKALSNSYLHHMNISREMLQEFLAVIKVVRRGECPEEKV